MSKKEQRLLELANFLKIKRAKIKPSQVGLPEGEHRRTPGLRREELAQLAGVGYTWYTWLEQCRPIHVSAQVIESLSRALMLDNQERIHLYELAQQPMPTDVYKHNMAVPKSVRSVLDNLFLCPSFVIDERWNIIEWNAAAALFFGNRHNESMHQMNIIRMMFLDSDYKKLFENWEEDAKGLLAHFRLSTGKYIDDPWLDELVEDVKNKSEEFRLWWPKHEVYADDIIVKYIVHPTAGKMRFDFSSFNVSNYPGLKLIVNTPCAETDTAEKVKLLLGI